MPDYTESVKYAVAALAAVYGTVYDIGSSANLLCTSSPVKYAS